MYTVLKHYGQRRNHFCGCRLGRVGLCVVYVLLRDRLGQRSETEITRGFESRHGHIPQLLSKRLYEYFKIVIIGPVFSYHLWSRASDITPRNFPLSLCGCILCLNTTANAATIFVVAGLVVWAYAWYTCCYEIGSVRDPRRKSLGGSNPGMGLYLSYCQSGCTNTLRLLYIYEAACMALVPGGKQSARIYGLSLRRLLPATSLGICKFEPSKVAMPV
jgi:hypothetical protein